jgi:hypothetical protein
VLTSVPPLCRPFVEPPVGERSFAGLRILVEGVDGIGGDIMHDPNAFLRHFDGTNRVQRALYSLAFASC